MSLGLGLALGMRSAPAAAEIVVPLELPRVGPFEGLAQTFVEDLSNWVPDSFIESYETVPLTVDQITLEYEVTAAGGVPQYNIFIWANQLSLNFDSLLSANGSMGGDGIDASPTFVGGNGGGGGSGGGGGGATGLDAVDTAAFGAGGSNGGDGGDGQSQGSDAVGGSFGWGSGNIVFTGLLQPSGGNGGAAGAGGLAGGGGGGSGGNIYVVVNQLLGNALSSGFSCLGGQAGAGAGGDAGDAGSDGAVWIAARAFSGGFSNIPAGSKIFEIQGSPGSFSLVERTFADNWNNL